MPIKGLTDKMEMGFPIIGELRKGSVKISEKQPGKDLNYFRFTSGDVEAIKALEAAYGKEPRAIEIMLPFRTPEQNFQAWKEHWVAGGLVHRCDGENTVLLRKKDGTFTDTPTKCPGDCKVVGRLTCVVWALKKSAFVIALTSSKWDILEISKNLQAIYEAAGTLSGLRYILRRSSREISTPDPKSPSGRSRRTKWLLSVELAPVVSQKVFEAMERRALQEPMRALPPAPLALAASNEYPAPDISGRHVRQLDAPAANFGPAPDDEDDDDSVVTCISGPTLLTATSQVAQLKAKGRNGARFTEWLKDNFDAETIDTVAESEGERLIAALAKILAQINAEEAHKPEDRPPSEAMSSLMAMIDVAREEIGRTLVTTACDGFTNGTRAVTDLNDDDALALIERLKQAIAEKAAKKARPTKPFAA